MNRKLILFLLATSVLIWHDPVEAQQPAKVPRIGYLDSSSRSVNAHFLEAFHKGLNELGWVEGKNIAFEYRFADGKGPAYQAELAGELVRLKVDLIVAASASVQRAKEATSQIPIVMTIHPNPVEAGIVQSLARPGGNVTGLTNLAAEISSKRLELLKEVVPKLSRVGVLMPAQTPTWEQQSGLALKDLEATARSLQVKLQELRVKVGPTEIDLDGGF
jgi:putative tryptophan/tyrosine transport system substrate-binding protein